MAIGFLDDHAFSVQDLGVPPWQCPFCGCPGAARQPDTAGDEDDEQCLQRLRAHLLDLSREVAAFAGSSGTGLEQANRSFQQGQFPFPTTGAQPFQLRPLNPLTAIHGEFIPGAEEWRRDRRSRRERAIERNRRRVEEAERESWRWAAGNPERVTQSILRPEAPSFKPANPRFRGSHQVSNTGRGPRGSHFGRGQ
ncbi:MAG: hypothetical protein Q9215_003627 [Flavoplaca cf. flavocitrina]